MQKKFEINRTKIKVSCQSGRKVATHNSKNDLPLESSKDSLEGQSAVIAVVLELLKKKLDLGPKIPYQALTPYIHKGH